MPSAREALQELQWRKCRNDPIYFFEHFWMVQHPEHGAIPFELFDAQKRGLEVFRRERLIVTLKARQIGWTTLVSAYAFWLAFFHPDRLIIFLSKGEREAQAILKMVKYGYKRLPDWMKERGPSQGAWNMTVCEFEGNGSSIESLPSKEDPARGRTAYLVVVDEWASLADPEDAWASIEPVADVGGRIIGLSTAKGYGDFFCTTYTEAALGNSDFYPIFEPWSARDDRNQDWYDTKARTMPSWLLHQEYPTTAEEAFIKSGNPYFDTDKLLVMLQNAQPGEIGYLASFDRIDFQPNEEGHLTVWDAPIEDDVYVVGADVAEGLAHGDYSSAHVIHWRTHQVVAHWHGHVAPEEFAEVLNDLGTYYNKALLGVEVNNHGLTTCKYLKDWHKYPHIFYSRIIDERSQRFTNKIGWVTSKKSRPLMLDELATSIREATIDIPDQYTIAELRTFVRDEFGRLRGSPYDDRTMSLAIAVQMIQYATQAQSQNGGMQWGTMEWWAAQIPKDRVNKRQPIGAHNGY
jgi:hypothetical protein